MKGANEYTQLFKRSVQVGQLFLVPGRHARGETFRIYVLPENVAAIRNGEGNAPLNEGAVEVYGATGGQLGWTETYGWLRKGKWQRDFEHIVQQKRDEMDAKYKEQVATHNDKVAAKKQLETKVLESYK